jgi:hypothetical protein
LRLKEDSRALATAACLLVLRLRLCAGRGEERDFPDLACGQHGCEQVAPDRAARRAWGGISSAPLQDERMSQRSWEVEKHMKRMTIATAVAVTFAAAAAFAAVTFDPATGTGFVGKGDVQTVFGWNNKALQDNADYVDFRYNSVTEASWQCSRPHPSQEGEEIVQNRNRTTSVQGVLTTVARDNSRGKDGPVTGFYLNGWEGDPVSDTEGPAFESCPADPSGFTLVPGSTVVVESGTGLAVTKDGVNWFPIG